MFKKIEILIIYIFFSLLNVPTFVFFGFLVRQELVGTTKLGMLSETALFLSEIPLIFKKFYNVQEVEDRFPLLEGFNGTPNLNESYLLLSKYDGDLKEGIVELIDLTDFKVLNTWNPDINAFNKSVEKSLEFKNIDRDNNNQRQKLIHPTLTKDGGLLFTGGPLRKIDACSNLIFQNAHDQFHHSLEKDADDNIWVPSYMFPQSLPVEKVGRAYIYQDGYRDDAIVKLSSNGEILFEKSVSQIFIDNGLEYLLFSHGDMRFTHDPIHLNDIQPVDFDGRFWKKGDVFLSLRHQSMVLLYRPSSNKIIWNGTGPFFHQHDVDILNDHSISIFNNKSKDFSSGNIVDGHNEVIVYNFETNKYSSYLNESLIKNDVRTKTSGRSEILKNGDLFIEESNYGRTLYFNSDGSLKWTHINRAENGKTYRVAWSRILHNEEDIRLVNNLLKSQINCND